MLHLEVFAVRFFSHLLLGAWVPCPEVDMSSGATNDVYFFPILTTSQAKFHSLSEQVVNLSPLRMGGRVTCPKGRSLCLIVACGHQCWWELGWQWGNHAPSLEWGGLLQYPVLAGAGQTDAPHVCAGCRPPLPCEGWERAMVGLGSRDPVEGCGLTGWWRFVSPWTFLFM